MSFYLTDLAPSPTPPLCQTFFDTLSLLFSWTCSCFILFFCCFFISCFFCIRVCTKRGSSHAVPERFHDDTKILILQSASLQAFQVSVRCSNIFSTTRVTCGWKARLTILEKFMNEIGFNCTDTFSTVFPDCEM